MEPQERIVLSQKNLHGNTSTILDGELVSVAGREAVVAIDGESVPRTVPLDAVRAASEVYGASSTMRPNEPQVVDAIIRR